MRITRNLLHKLARDTVKQRKRSEPDLHAAYLIGSLLTEDPLLGGTTDIDLMLVHRYLAPAERETVALTPEISLDILHKTQDDYNQLRQLRQDPWMGYPLTYNHIVLFDTDHWLEFAQSSVTAEFHRSDNVLARVNALLSSARDRWRTMVFTPPPTHLEWLDQFFDALRLGANAISGLIGPPLTTRRFMLTYNQRLETLGIPEVWAGFCGLLGCSGVEDGSNKDWLEAFEQDLIHVSESTTPPIHLSSCRQAYYVQGIRALAHNENPAFLIWPLLRIWLDIHLALPQSSPGSEAWQGLLETLKLTDEVSEEKTEALDAYLDNLEVLIEAWSNTYGI